MSDDGFLVPRKCFLEPIPEIWAVADLLHDALEAHLSRKFHAAEELIRKADIPAIAKWTDSIWGCRSQHVHRFRPAPNSPPVLSMEMRPRPRMPTLETCQRVKERDGFFCRFCGIPVIEKSIRTKIREAYPGALRWGKKNTEQHAAFQCMWLLYDHVVPNSRGGESSFDNVIVTCAPCNFGRMEWMLEEVGLIDPRIALTSRSWGAATRWKGLVNFVGAEPNGASR